MKRCTRVLILLLVIFGLAGCGDADENENNFSNFSNRSNSSGDADIDVDAGGDVGADATPDAENDVDNDTDPPVVVEGSSCSKPTDLGSLSTGQEHIFNSTLVAPADDLDSTCDLESEGVETGVRIFAIEVDVASRVGFFTTASPSRLDLRRGGCDEPDEVLTCTQFGNYSADLQPGETYYLAVWGDFNQGDFELRANVREAICNPEEPDWCEAGELNECRNTASIETYSCVEDCAGETACTGDTCEAAIAVDLSTSTSATFTGQLGAYTNTWTADQMTNCGFNDSGAGMDTPNAEVIFEVSGLSAGQQLSVDSALPGDVAFYVLADCSADQCLAAVDSDELGDQRLAFDVPDDGTYFVVVESLTGGERDFQFEFETQ